MTGDRLGLWTGPQGQQGRALVVTNKLSAIVDQSTVVVVERRSGKMLWNDTFDFSTSTLCFDNDVRAANPCLLFRGNMAYSCWSRRSASRCWRW